jgi:hypothetical protein
MRYVTVLLLALLTSFIVSNCFQFSGSVRAASGITLSGNTVMNIVNGTRVVDGDIIIRNNATLYLYNSNLTMSMKKSYGYRIRLENPSGGYPRFIMVNSNLTSVRSMFFNIEVYGGFVNFSYVNMRVTALQYSTFDFFVYTNSNVSLSNSKLYRIMAFNSSIVNVSYSNVYGLYSKGHAEISAFKISFLSDIFAEDSSFISVSAPPSGVMSTTYRANIYTKGNSTILISRIQISIGTSTDAKIETFDHGNLTISDSSITTQYVDVQIMTHGYSFLSLNHVSLGQAVLSFYDDSVVDINRGTLTQTRVYARNSSHLSIDYSSQDWLLQSEDSSNVQISYSNVTLLRSVDNSNVSASDSLIGVFQIRNSCNSLFLDSVIDEVSLEFVSVNFDFSNLSPGIFDRKSFEIPGLLFNFTLVNSQIKVGWSITFYGASNVSFIDSNLWFIGVSEDSIVEVTNSTVYSTPIATGVAMLHFVSYVDFHVVDLLGNSVSGANVTLSCGGVILDSKVSNEKGIVMFALERWVNASGVFPSSPFNVTVEWSGYKESKYVGLGQEEWILSNFVSSVVLASPWWYWYVVYFGVGVAICVVGIGVFFVFRRRKKTAVQG